jgi:hypothetical protein
MACVENAMRCFPYDEYVGSGVGEVEMEHSVAAVAGV